MRIKFDSHLDYQDDAIASVVDLFKGQESAQSMFAVSAGAYNSTLENFQSKGIGFGNRDDLRRRDPEQPPADTAA